MFYVDVQLYNVLCTCTHDNVAISNPKYVILWKKFDRKA